MPPYTTDNHSHCCDAPSSSRPLHHRPSSRPLHHHPTKSSMRNNIETGDGLLQLAAMELEVMRRPPSSHQKRGSNGSVSSSGSISSSTSISSSCSTTEEIERSFPSACLHLLHTLPGNSRCHDCHTGSASWASVTYGITLCLQCSGKHRGLGVNCSFIKSLTLDSWKRREILCMLEGGNEQLSLFFDRHGMGGENATSVGVLDRYRTKAASFYRQHLRSHAKQVAEGGLYEGREASRKSNKQRNKTAASGKLSKREKSTEQPHQQLATEKESVELTCGAVEA